MGASAVVSCDSERRPEVQCVVICLLCHPLRQFDLVVDLRRGRFVDVGALPGLQHGVELGDRLSRRNHRQREATKLGEQGQRGGE